MSIIAKNQYKNIFCPDGTKFVINCVCSTRIILYSKCSFFDGNLYVMILFKCSQCSRWYKRGWRSRRYFKKSWSSLKVTLPMQYGRPVMEILWGMESAWLKGLATLVNGIETLSSSIPRSLGQPGKRICLWPCKITGLSVLYSLV